MIKNESAMKGTFRPNEDLYDVGDVGEGECHWCGQKTNNTFESPWHRHENPPFACGNCGDGECKVCGELFCRYCADSNDKDGNIVCEGHSGGICYDCGKLRL